MIYPKPWSSYADQLDQLIERGMAVTDRARALDYLERIGYYRLSGYWFAFRERSEPLCLLDEHGRKPKKVREERIALDAFRVGTTFQNAVDLYVFDKQLRLLVMDALERIEVALRVDVSHTLGQLDRFAYLKPELFHDEFSIKLDKAYKLVEKLNPYQVYMAGELSDPHGTHRVCADAILEAMRRAKGKGNKSQVWLYRGAWEEWEPHELERVVPLSPEDLEQKKMAIFRHQSQKDRAMFPGNSDRREFWQRAEDRNLGTAKIFDELGLPEYFALEGFVEWKDNQ